MHKRHKIAQLGAERDSQANIQRRQRREESSNTQMPDSACAAKHAIIIQRTGLLHPLHERQKVQSLLGLQRTYGNRFVQRVIAQHILQTKLQVSQPQATNEQEGDRVAEQVMQIPEPQTQRQPEEEMVHTRCDQIRPNSIQRAEDTEPSPVVIVSGANKIPDLEEDAVEKIIRTAGAKQEKAGAYRFVPVSGYADFVAKAHARLKADECASTVLISGHGGSDANSAWQVMGSVTDPKRGWGTTDIGNNNGRLFGADVLQDIKFCSPGQVLFGGCNFAATTPGIKFMQEVANSSGCVVYAYATQTTPKPETGFPEPLPEEKGKKAGKP